MWPSPFARIFSTHSVLPFNGTEKMEKLNVMAVITAASDCNKSVIVVISDCWPVNWIYGKDYQNKYTEHNTCV